MWHYKKFAVTKIMSQWFHRALKFALSLRLIKERAGTMTYY